MNSSEDEPRVESQTDVKTAAISTIPQMSARAFDMTSAVTPAARSIEGEDLWKPPGSSDARPDLRDENWKVDKNASYSSLVLAALGSIAAVGGIVFLLLIYSPAVAQLAKTVVGLPYGSKELLTTFAGIIFAAGFILLIVAAVIYGRTISAFQRQVDLFRREGLATVQAMEAMRSITKNR